MSLKVLAVDDERPALEDLTRLLEGQPEIAEIEQAQSGAEALQRLTEHAFDAVFLDVRMPGLDGVELARVIRNFAHPPCLVFVSAYESAAVEAFELRAVDYLVKPVSRARITEAVERIVEQRPPGEVINVDNHLVALQSIRYVEAHGDYARLHTDDGRFLLRASLGDLERRWQAAGFVRVHRSFLVQLRRASELRAAGDGVVLRVGDAEVPVARRQVADLRRRLRA
jgi:two-component system response regulator LytT